LIFETSACNDFIVLSTTWMFGPYFGADAQNLYNTAQAS
jgi:hypothetical protein